MRTMCIVTNQTSIINFSQYTDTNLTFNRLSNIAFVNCFSIFYLHYIYANLLTAVLMHLR